MRHSNYLTWFRRLLVLGAVVAGVTASAAVAIPVVDPQDTGTANLAAPVSRPPDVQDAMTARHAAAATLKDDSLVQHTTAAGLKADGLRWQGITRTYEQLEAAKGLPTSQGLKADGMRLQGIAQVYKGLQAVPDVVERYAATHSSGAVASAASVVSRPPDIQDTASSLSASAPDVFERYAGVHADDLSSSATPVSRPPDVSDAALAVRYGSASTVQSDGFDWSDWAIGIGSGLGLALIVGAAVLMSRQLRHHAQTA
jgi:hypothetical protein